MVDKVCAPSALSHSGLVGHYEDTSWILLLLGGP